MVGKKVAEKQSTFYWDTQVLLESSFGRHSCQYLLHHQSENFQWARI